MVMPHTLINILNTRKFAQVMEERLSKLKSAHLMQLSEINLDDYTIAVQKKINAQFPIAPERLLLNYWNKNLRFFFLQMI